MNEAIVGFVGAILGVGLTLIYQWFTFRLQRKDQFRLAALDKRLEKHQEAFTLWHELLSVRLISDFLFFRGDFTPLDPPASRGREEGLLSPCLRGDQGG